MKLVMTLMVRDEADIIDSMINHHISQGIDKMIITDNGSVDGTVQILEKYVELGFVDLRHDSVQRKQQSSIVTQMARDAYNLYQADWVLNADADEFWLAKNRTITLREAFMNISVSICSFVVPVIDMTGPPAEAGTGLQRLIYRDKRSESELSRIGLRAHATHDSAHIGASDVNVSQGNHYVSIASQGEPDPEYSVEVLHYPWRSWEQFRKKVENAGRAYEENPDLTPSPNHHGMRDYRHLKQGTLRSLYVARSLSPKEIEDSANNPELLIDESIATHINSPVMDRLFEPSVEDQERSLGLLRAAIFNSEAELSKCDKELAAALDQISLLREENVKLESRCASLESANLNLAEEKISIESELTALRSRRIVKVADRIAESLRRK